MIFSVFLATGGYIKCSSTPFQEGDRHLRYSQSIYHLCFKRQKRDFLTGPRNKFYIILMRGTFLLKLSIVEQASSLMAHSSFAVDGNINSLVPWYHEFRAIDLDTQFHVHCFPVTLLFPRLAMELRLCLVDFRAHCHVRHIRRDSGQCRCPESSCCRS